jgi:tripartite-type tricarboxylate transporter receptor subunit TctC
MLDRRGVIAGLGTVLGTALGTTLGALPLRRAAAAGAYPARPVSLIVPFAAGGTTDMIARAVAEAMRGTLGQPVIVENRSGAGGALGTAQIAKATPDGYTIGMGTASTLAINPAAYRSLPFDVLKDLAPVGAIAVVPNIMTINPRIEVDTISEFISRAWAQKGRFSYGSSGNGSVSHLLGEQFNLATQAELRHVPYRGIGPALNDAVAGQVDVLFDNLPTSLPLVRGGRLRPLAVSGSKRLAVLPKVPTFAEAHLDELNWMAFFGLVAPSATPAPIISRLNEALGAALAQPKLRSRLAAQQATVTVGSAEQFGADIRRELARMQRATRAAGISID